MHYPNFIHLAARGDSFCEGDFAHYLNRLLTRATHLTNPYHNLTHTLYVTWKCVEAADYHVKAAVMTERQARNFIIAGLFHDWNHSGTKLYDSDQIRRAIAALREYLLDKDEPYLGEIESIIWATEFPYRDSSVPRAHQLIREIDLSQALQQTWLQQVPYGLALEWSTPEEPVTPREMIEKQEGFLNWFQSFLEKNGSEWGKQRFAPLIEEKIQDVRLLLDVILAVP